MKLRNILNYFFFIGICDLLCLGDLPLGGLTGIV